MSETVLVSRSSFRLVSRESATAAVSQSECQPDELTLARERCRVLTESEHALRQELAQERERQQALRDGFAQALETYGAELEREAMRALTSLSVRMAGMILRRELPDHEMIRDVIQRTLAPLTDLRGTRVRVNPEVAARLLKTGGHGNFLDAADRVEIVSEPALGLGDVTMETPVGFFDARLAERLKLVESLILERVASKTPDTQAQEDVHAQAG